MSDNAPSTQGKKRKEAILTHLGWRVTSKLVFVASTASIGCLIKFWSSLPQWLALSWLIAVIVLLPLSATHELVSADFRDKKKKALEQQLESSKLEGAREFAEHVSNFLTEHIFASEKGWDANSTETYIRQMVNATRRACEIKNARACLYEYEPRIHDKQVGEDPILRPLEFGDSLRVSTREFTNESDHGRAAISLVQDQKSVLVEDVRNSPNFAVAEDIEGYETFIAASVHYRGQEFGMLTVDAPTSGQLTPNHEQIVRLMAKTAAVGLYHRRNDNLTVESTAQKMASTLEALSRRRLSNGQTGRSDPSAGE